MSKNYLQYYRLTNFFTRYFKNFPALLLVNLLFCIPAAVFGFILFLMIRFTGSVSSYVLLTCIPLLSPFLAAVSDVCKKVTTDCTIQPIKDFYNGMRKNAKYFLIYSIFVYIISAGLWITFSFYNNFAGNPIVNVSCILSVVAALFFLLMSFTINVMIVSVKLNFKEMIKNSIWLIISGFANHLKILLSLFLVFGVVYIIAYLPLPSATLWGIYAVLTLTVLPVLVVYIIVFNAYQIVEKNVIDTYKHNTPKQNFPSESQNFSYQELKHLAEGNPDEYVSVGGRILKRSTIAKMAEAHKNDID